MVHLFITFSSISILLAHALVAVKGEGTESCYVDNYEGETHQVLEVLFGQGFRSLGRFNFLLIITGVVKLFNNGHFVIVVGLRMDAEEYKSQS